MNKEKREWLTSLRLVIIIITIAITVRTIFFSPIIVDGPSMLPTLESQDQLIINKFVYRMKEPERFDIVVFHASERSEEHTSELQSRGHLVCRLLLEKKKHLIRCK